MENRVRFTARDIEDPVGEPQMEVLSMSVKDYKGYSAFYNQQLNDGADLDTPYSDQNRFEVEEPKQEGVKVKIDDKKPEKPAQGKENPTNPSSITGEQSEQSNDDAGQQEIEDALAKKRKGKKDEKKFYSDNPPPIPYHMMLSQEELKRKQDEAIERFCPKGCISGNLSDLQRSAGEFIEVMLRNLLMNRNDLVDSYHTIEVDRHNKVKLNKNKMIDDFNNKKIEELANSIDGMELKDDDEKKAVKKMDIPIQEDQNKEKVIEELSMLLKFKEENPELNMEKMTKKEKDYFNYVITPSVKEIEKQAKDNPEITENGLDEDKANEVYNENRYNVEKRMERKQEKKKESSLSPSL